MFCFSHNSSHGVNENFRVRLLFHPCPNSIQDSIEIGDDCGKELICIWGSYWNGNGNENVNEIQFRELYRKVDRDINTDISRTMLFVLV